MSFNDPAGVVALLDQLKSSSAWQELGLGRQEIETTQVSVTSLLSQLKDSEDTSKFTSQQSLPVIRQLKDSEDISKFTSQQSLPVIRQLKDSEDISKFTFQQSLPVVSQLADNPAFIAALIKLKKDQDELERLLWSEREAIYTKYDEKFKVAQTKANMIGTTVSQHEARMLTEAFKKEIDKFDRDRVIPAWDGLVSRQQMDLAHNRVPTMFISNQAEDRQRQQQVINVLENILDTA